MLYHSINKRLLTYNVNYDCELYIVNDSENHDQLTQPSIQHSQLNSIIQSIHRCFTYSLYNQLMCLFQQIQQTFQQIIFHW